MKMLPLLILLTMICSHAIAGEFFSDFETAEMRGVRLFGKAKRDFHGGVEDSGVLWLTRANAYEVGSAIIEPLDEDMAVRSFIVTAKLRMGGGTGGDAMGLSFAPDLPNEAYNEAAGNGLKVIFDTFQNKTEVAPGIRVYLRGKNIAQKLVPDIRTNGFVPFMIKVDPDGTMDLSYNDEMLFSNHRTTATNINGRFGWGGRTGRLTDHHAVDELHILTKTQPRAFLDTFAPTGHNASPSPMLQCALQDHGSRVDVKTIKMMLDGKPVSHEIVPGKRGRTVVVHHCEELFQPGSAHAATISFAEQGNSEIQTFTFGFRISDSVILGR